MSSPSVLALLSYTSQLSSTDNIPLFADTATPPPDAALLPVTVQFPLKEKAETEALYRPPPLSTAVLPVSVMFVKFASMYLGRLIYIAPPFFAALQSEIVKLEMDMLVPLKFLAE